jgi:uncharacterized protein YhfF
MIVVDSNESEVATIEIVSVETIRLGDANLALALDEGEGFRSVEEWRIAHEQFWQPLQLDDDTEIVVERFRLIQTL